MKKMNNLLVVLSLLVAIAGLAGCNNAADSNKNGGTNDGNLNANEQKLVGRWIAETLLASGISSGYEFNSDISYATISAGITQQIPNSKWSATDNEIVITYTVPNTDTRMNYSWNGNKLVINIGTSVTYIKQ